MDDKPIEIPFKDFVKLYAEAILESFVECRNKRIDIEKRLASDTDKAVQEVKVHTNGEVHVYFLDGTHLEYSAKELGMGETFKYYR